MLALDYCIVFTSVSYKHVCCLRLVMRGWKIFSTA